MERKLRVSQGFWGTREHWQNIEGNKGTLANFWEQGNKIRKITVRKHSENVWEHGNIGQFWKETREQGSPQLGDPQSCALAVRKALFVFFFFLVSLLSFAISFFFSLIVPEEPLSEQWRLCSGLWTHFVSLRLPARFCWDKL